MQITTTKVPVPQPAVMQRRHTITVTDSELLFITAAVGMCPFHDVDKWARGYEVTIPMLPHTTGMYAALRDTCHEHGLLGLLRERYRHCHHISGAA